MSIGGMLCRGASPGIDFSTSCSAAGVVPQRAPIITTTRGARLFIKTSTFVEDHEPHAAQHRTESASLLGVPKSSPLIGLLHGYIAWQYSRQGML